MSPSPIARSEVELVYYGLQPWVGPVFAHAFVELLTEHNDSWSGSVGLDFRPSTSFTRVHAIPSRPSERL